MKKFRIDKYVDGKGETYFRPKRKFLFLHLPVFSKADNEIFVEFLSYTDAYRYTRMREDEILMKKRKCVGEANKTPLHESYKVEVITPIIEISVAAATVYLQEAFSDGTGSCRGSFTVTTSSDDPGNIKVLIKRSFREDRRLLDLNFPEYDYDEGAILQIATELELSSKDNLFMQHLVINVRERGRMINEERVAVHRLDAQ